MEDFNLIQVMVAYTKLNTPAGQFWNGSCITNLVIYETLSDSLSDLSKNIKDNRLYYNMISYYIIRVIDETLKPFQLENNIQFTTFVIKLNNTIKTDLYTKREIISLPQQVLFLFI